MKKTTLLICTSVTALCVMAGSALPQSPNAGDTGDAASSSKDMPSPGATGSSRMKPSDGGGLERGSTPERGMRERNRSEGTDRRDGPRSGDTAGAKNGNRDGSASTGASGGETGRDDSKMTNERKERSKKSAEDRKDEDGATSGASEGTAGTDSPKGSVTQLSGEKRSKVQSAFRSHKSEAVVKDIDIDVSVGVTVPSSVTLYTVPEEVVVIVPEYRRYKYFVFEDRVVIVDPDTLAIVDILIVA